jgi:peptidoglycan/xylan/chitin deacetylase (PgdA/CDA1 family)
MVGPARAVGALAVISILAGFAQAPVPPPVRTSVPGPTATEPASLLQVQLPPDVNGDGGVVVKPQDPRNSAPPDCARLKCVALTMDDGPVPQTASVLALLRREQVHATFFLIGRNAELHPEIVRRMLADGNAVGNHSWTHPEFWRMSKKAIRRELARTDAVIKKATGERPTLVRPPYGEVNAKVRKVAKDRGDALILWDVDPLDWKDHKAKTVVKRVLAHARRGSIILTHDVWPSTRHAYKAIIRGLKARGFTLVTVPELLAGKARPGRVYLRR